MAIKWWREGNIAAILKYCKQDVRVTKELFEYIRDNKKIFFKEGSRKREVPIDTSNWTADAEHSMTFSLPF
jgi:DEAD/DEAH box helicase domain-containing protein